MKDFCFWLSVLAYQGPVLAIESGICSGPTHCSRQFCPRWSFGFLVTRRQINHSQNSQVFWTVNKKNKSQPKIPSPPLSLLNAMHMIASQMHTQSTSITKVVRGSKVEFRQRKEGKDQTELALFVEDTKTSCNDLIALLAVWDTSQGESKSVKVQWV